MSVPEKLFEPGMGCPLDGVRVIDMSRLVSGNMVSLQLADFGAEVIKIEDPKRGDPLRAWQTDGVSVHWKVYSRNKKSLAMSLREARGRELFLDLVETSQVLIENFRPGTLETIGFAPEVLHRRNPALIHPAGVRLGSGRALPRPARLRHIGREHVGLRVPHRLPGPRAGLAANRARRHGRWPLRFLCGDGRVARSGG